MGVKTGDSRIYFILTIVFLSILIKHVCKTILMGNRLTLASILERNHLKDIGLILN